MKVWKFTLNGFRWKSTEELPLTTLESDTKFEEKLAHGFKNDMTNLVNINESSGKSENFHFDVLLLSIAYKVSAKKSAEELSLMALKSDPNFEWKLSFCLKNDIRNLMYFNLSGGKLHFDGIFLSNTCNVWAKIIQASCVVKNGLWF